MIRRDGRGQFDTRENGSNSDRKRDEQANPDRGHQGFLLNDSQFESLIGALDRSKYLSHQVQLRAELDFVREFVLKSHLRNAQGLKSIKPSSRPVDRCAFFWIG